VDENGNVFVSDEGVIRKGDYTERGDDVVCGDVRGRAEIGMGNEVRYVLDRRMGWR